MHHRLQKNHRYIWVGMGLLMPILFVLAWWSRPPEAYQVYPLPTSVEDSIRQQQTPADNR